MLKIPKKVIERFKKNVSKFQKVLSIASDRDVNESDTVSIINDILAEVFGYDKYLEVTSELAIRGTYCDLAIKVDEKIQFIIEVKAIGISLKEQHIKQAIDYGANKGINWVILTNGVEWQVYRLKFEQPIHYDLVCTFNFNHLNLKDDRDLQHLFMLTREGLHKDAREDYYEKVRIVNKYIIGHLILAEPFLNSVKRELKKMAEGIKIENDDIRHIIRHEVLKREIVEGDEADEANAKINKFLKKVSSQKKQTKKPPIVEKQPIEDAVSFSDKLLMEVDEEM